MPLAALTYFDGIDPRIYPMPPPQRQKRGASIRQKSGFHPSFSLQNFGFENQSPQPPHRRSEKSGAQMRGDDGISAKILSFTGFGFENQAPQPPHLKREKSGAEMKGIDSIELPMPGPKIFAFENQPPHIPRIRSKPIGRLYEFVSFPTTDWSQDFSADFGDGNVPNIWIPDAFYHYRRPPLPLTALASRSQFSAFTAAFPYGWEVQPMPPLEKHPRLSVGALRQKTGFPIPFQLITTNWGFEVMPVQPPIRWRRTPDIQMERPESEGPHRFIAWPGDTSWVFRRPSLSYQGLVARSQFSTQPALAPFDWHPEPLYRNKSKSLFGLRQRSGFAISPPTVLAFGWGFDPQSFQPPHFRPEKGMSAIQRGDDGTEAKFIFVAPPIIWVPSNYPDPRYPRYSPMALAFRSQFAVSRPIIPFSWEMSPWQPPHRGVEHHGNILHGIDANEAKFSRFVPWQFDLQPFQPPYAGGEYSSAIFIGEDGIELPFIAPPPPPPPPPPVVIPPSAQLSPLLRGSLNNAPNFAADGNNRALRIPGTNIWIRL